MSKFAIMDGNIVSNIIVADSLKEAQALGIAIEYTDSNAPGIGWIYDQLNQNFNKPEEDINA